MRLNVPAFIAITAIVVGCNLKKDIPEYNFGEITPDVYVAVGTGNTGGYMDDALYHNGQSNSYAQIISSQMSMISPVPLETPFVSETSVGINLNGDARLKMGYKTDCNNEESLSPVRAALFGDNSILSTNIYNAATKFTNLGMANLHLTEVSYVGYGDPVNSNSNPYFERMTSSAASASVLSDATASNPTFVTIMLGDQDVLSYASSGGTTNPLLTASGGDGIGFDGTLDNIVSQLTQNGATGAIANIPDVTEFPYFTTIPQDGLDIDDEQATTLNQIYGGMGVGISFQEGPNSFVIECDCNLPWGVRQMQEGERVLLSVPLDSVKCYGLGSIVPIPDKYVLTLSEIDSVQTMIDSYNSIIFSAASTYNLAHVNVNELMKSILSGIIYNGISIDMTFVSGGAFSLDGRHLSPMGNALLANEFIESLNQKYSASIPKADVGDYRGNIFP